MIFSTNPGLLKLTPYQPGKPIDELKRELGLDNIIKLASNENPLGPSPRALECFQQAGIKMHLYPDANAYDLKQALAKHLPCQENQLTIDSGLESLIHTITSTFAEPGDEIIYSKYAFALYAIAAHISGATPIEVPARQWGHDLSAMLDAISPKTKLIFLANPNNPTGTYVAKEDFNDFIAKVPENVIVICDEAYFEYMHQADYPITLPLLEKYPNLMILRTFSKIYGLAGLRVGYSIASKEITALLHRRRFPFSVNMVAQMAATLALSDREHSAKTKALTITEQQRYLTFCQTNGLDYTGRAGNFLTINVKRDANAVFQALLKRGFIVRPLQGYGMPQHIRISIGLMQQNILFLEALFKELSL